MNGFPKLFVCLTLLFFFIIPASQAGEKEDFAALEKVAEKYGGVEQYKRFWCNKMLKHALPIIQARYQSEETLEGAIEMKMLRIQRLFDRKGYSLKSELYEWMDQYIRNIAEFIYSVDGGPLLAKERIENRCFVEGDLFKDSITSTLAAAKRGESRLENRGLAKSNAD